MCNTDHAQTSANYAVKVEAFIIDDFQVKFRYQGFIMPHPVGVYCNNPMHTLLREKLNQCDIYAEDCILDLQCYIPFLEKI